MRFSGRLLVVPVLLAALAWPSADAARPLRLHGTARAAKVFVGLVGGTESGRLARLDETSLRPVAPLGPRLGSVDAWTFSRDGGRLAVATHPRGAGIWRDAIRFVGLQSLRLQRKAVLLNGAARALLWSRPDRVVALVTGDASWSALVTIDVAARRVVASKVLEGNITAIARTPNSLALLAAPANAIGAPTLALVDGSGNARSLSLERVRAGVVWPQGSTEPMIGTERLPGLAVDPNGNRAYVISADGPAAVIDLATLAVAYHDLAAPRSVLARVAAWLQPSAEAKGLSGPQRRARWLGNGLLAVTGTNESAIAAGSDMAYTSSPAGLAIVDTHDWTVRVLDPGANMVTPVADTLFATGATWSSSSQETHGMGLAAYGSDRALRYHLWPGTSAWVEAAWAGRVYVQVTSMGRATVYVVEIATGTVVGKRTSGVPMPLLGPGPDL